MDARLAVVGRDRALAMYADWTDRIQAGEYPTNAPARPRGVERNVVVTMWDWSDPEAYMHDLISADKRDPNVNANGPVYGAPENSTDDMPVVDPNTHTAGVVPLQVRDADTPNSADTPPKMPSPYWGDEVIWHSRSVAHSFAMDSRARVWIAARVRAAETPAFCQPGSTHPSAQAFPIERSNRQVQMYDPETGEVTTVNTCFGTHHLNFAYDDKLWFCGSGPVVAWFDTKVFDETGDEELAQGWTVQVLDTNGNGRRDEYVEPGEPIDPTKDARIERGFYGVAPSPLDGSIWGSTLGFPGGLVRLVPGDDPVDTALAEFYEVPWNESGAAVEGFSPRGMDVDSDGVVWTVLASGHFASFDRTKCTGPLNGPTATGRHCPEGWALYQFPGPNFKGAVDSGAAESAYYNFTDRFDLLGPRREHSAGHRQPVRGRACAGGRRVPQLPRALPARELLRQGPRRPHRRPRRRLEGTGHLDDVGQPDPVPRRGRDGARGACVQVPGAAGPAGPLAVNRGAGAKRGSRRQSLSATVPNPAGGAALVALAGVPAPVVLDRQKVQQRARASPPGAYRRIATSVERKAVQGRVTPPFAVTSLCRAGRARRVVAVVTGGFHTIHPMKTLRIGIADYGRMKARTMAIARGEHKPARGEPTVWFTSIESFAKVLSGRNRELLTLIAREEPDSLTELAGTRGAEQVEPVADAQDDVALRARGAEGGTARHRDPAGPLRPGEPGCPVDGHPRQVA